MELLSLRGSLIRRAKLATVTLAVTNVALIRYERQMAYKNIRTKFSNLVHRSISDPVWRAIQADALSTEIGDRRGWINNTGHGPLFATLQVVLTDEFSITDVAFEDALQLWPQRHGAFRSLGLESAP